MEFVEQYNENDVAQSEELQEMLRSLLNIRVCIINSLDAARQGTPLIFALEINGTPTQLENLSKEGIVKAVSTNVQDTSKIDTTPEAYQTEFLDPTIQAMTPQQLYQQAKMIVYGSL